MLALLAVGTGVLAVLRPETLTGWSTPLAIATVCLALLTGWTWLSGTWSEGPWRAVFDMERVAVYLFALLLFGMLGRRGARASTAIHALAAAIVAVCAAALLTRLFPATFPASTPYGPQRLSFPLGYWNSLGLFAGIGVVLLVHLASDLTQRPAIRALAAAGAPLAAATIYLTFSRGATGAVLLGVVLYAIVGRPRGIVSAAIAIVPTTLFVVLVAYTSELLGTYQSTSDLAAGQRHQLAAALFVGCAAAAAVRLALRPLDRRLELMRGPTPELRRRLLTAGLAGVLVAAVIAVAADAPGRIADAYRSFTKPEIAGDARTRFQEVTLSGRQEHWKVALDYYRDHPLAGAGAGTFETQWLRSRPNRATAAHAHSLYLETLSELGLVGLALLVAALVAMLGGLLARARGPRRAMFGALFAATVMWAVHAGVDYDWELPAVGFGLFAVTGLALAEPGLPRRRSGGVLRAWPRVLVAAGCVVLCVTAVRTTIADAAQNAADDQITKRADCSAATADAHTALDFLGDYPKPYEVLGVCALNAGRYAEATSDMRRAAGLDPTQWRYAYGLAIARAAQMKDPRPAIRRARRLNPRALTFAPGGSGAQLSRPLGPAGWREAVSMFTWPPY